jgi:lysine 6-dehydrogenase
MAAFGIEKLIQRFLMMISKERKMKLLALGGAGYMGELLVRQLIKRSDHEITIADKDIDKAKKLASSLGKKVSAKSIDADDFTSLVQIMKDADMTVNTIGPYYKVGANILKAAIAARTNFVDICDDYDATIDELNLGKEAEEAGIIAIIGAGASPGLTNMFAKWGADKLERVNEIHTFWCESAVDPTGPAAVRHWLNSIHGNIPTYKNGKWISVQAFSEPEIVRFPHPINEIELRHVGHPEPITIPRYIKGVKLVTNKGAIYPSFMNKLYEMMSIIGFGSNKEFVVREGVSLPLRDLASRLIRSIPHFAPELFPKLLAEQEERYEGIGSGFKTVIRGEAQGKTIEYSYEVVSSTTPLVTTVPAAIIALMVSRKEIKHKGVHAPEGVVNPDMFFKEFEGCGITIWQSKKETGELG